MIKHPKRHFGTMAIFAGSPSADLKGAQIMRKLKEESKEPLSFVGLGGKQMEGEGLVKNYGDLS